MDLGLNFWGDEGNQSEVRKARRASCGRGLRLVAQPQEKILKICLWKFNFTLVLACFYQKI